jgi:hypothetical protein
VQVLVQVIKQTPEGEKRKLVPHYIKRKMCACGYLYPFCSCDKWMRTGSGTEIKPTIKWEKFTYEELIDFLKQRKEAGCKLSIKDEKLLYHYTLRTRKKDETQHRFTVAADHQSLLEAHEAWYFS